MAGSVLGEFGINGVYSVSVTGKFKTNTKEFKLLDVRGLPDFNCFISEPGARTEARVKMIVGKITTFAAPVLTAKIHKPGTLRKKSACSEWEI